jgi:hypothetical protein
VPAIVDGRAKAWCQRRRLHEFVRGDLVNHQIDTQRPNAKAVRDEIIRKASRAGLGVALVPYSATVPNGYWLSALNINGLLCAIQIITNAQMRMTRRQVYAHTGVLADALEKFDAIIFYIAVPGYRRTILLVPTEDLRSLWHTKRIVGRKSLYIPLAYRPDNAVIDFWAYRDRFDLLSPDRGASRE